MRKIWIAAMISVPIFLQGCAAQGLKTEEQGRGLLSKYKEAVVTVKLTVKESMSFGGKSSQKKDSTLEATGTCIDQNGLTVVSLRTVDRGEMMGTMNFDMDEETFKSRYETEITDVKIIFEGKEVPAVILLRDKDLDLAFLRPAEKLEKTPSYVDLAVDGKAQILSQFFILDRMGKNEGRAPVVLLSRVASVIEKPRTFYIAGDLIANMTLGAPALTPEGKVLGIVVYRIQPVRHSDSGRGSGPVPGVLPASDILEVARQAAPAASASQAEQGK